jgi:hypothetical protein
VFLFLSSPITSLSRDFPEKKSVFVWIDDSSISLEQQIHKKGIRFEKKTIKNGLEKYVIRNTKNLRFLTIPIKEIEIICEAQKVHTYRYTFELKHRTKLLKKLDELYKQQTNVVSNGKDVTFEYSFSNTFLWVDFIKDNTRLYMVAPR